jgi:hypothetical protein
VHEIDEISRTFLSFTFTHGVTRVIKNHQFWTNIFGYFIFTSGLNSQKQVTATKRRRRKKGTNSRNEEKLFN